MHGSCDRLESFGKRFYEHLAGTRPGPSQSSALSLANPSDTSLLEYAHATVGAAEDTRSTNKETTRGYLEGSRMTTGICRSVRSW